MRKRNISLRTPDEFSKAGMEGINIKLLKEIFGVIKEIREESEICGSPKELFNWMKLDFQ
jgi:hypothetical protein